MTVHILIVDDHPVVRFGLRGMLEAYDDLRVVGEAGSGDEAIVLASTTRPDVVLMDLRMPGTDGATATARIRQEHPGIRVLVLTTYEGDADILPAIEAGATGYLLKDTPIGTLTDAIRAAARGETVLAPPVAARLVTRLQAPAGEQLTPREVQVLGLVARGLSNSEIGRQLYIGEATVKTHLLRTFVKLGVNDRTAAVTVALSRGVLTSPHR
ncbi:response regulator [Streptomyces sp. WI04-05B]|jgi:DNA-binding NarL/FixJ family response regulator|uniref:response regulator transcription factor n=1 Tax=Streptomyces TaxID=1883 RepID=UPI0029A875E2|nr:MULTISPECIES: response regulator transcription factor [unclassified Streptomyces]MDX2544982.1 response regulator transcription factor [Streptomyces sp. WI04-05B]MDX2587473.1 response regulator transcription factor [Streptomyces sp. WI04-05A]